MKIPFFVATDACKRMSSLKFGFSLESLTRTDLNARDSEMKVICVNTSYLFFLDCSLTDLIICDVLLQ